MQIVIIPGNPGHAQLYSLFKKELENLNYNVIVLSPLSTPNILYTLEDQIEYIVDMLKNIICHPTILIGHSIGAYMLLHAIKKLDPKTLVFANIVKVVAMYPFLEADLSVPRARQLAIISKYYTIIGCLGGVLSYMPYMIKSKIFKTLSKDKLDEHVIRTCCSLLNYSNLRQYTYFANCYIKREHQFDWKLITSLGSLLVIYACPNDTWMPISLYNKIVSLNLNSSIEWHENMTHAFIVNSDMCKIAASKIAASSKLIPNSL